MPDYINDHFGWGVIMSSYFSRYVTIGKFSEISGYSKRAIESKINKGIWADGIHYLRAPDNRILVDIESFEKWVESSL